MIFNECAFLTDIRLSFDIFGKVGTISAVHSPHHTTPHNSSWKYIIIFQVCRVEPSAECRDLCLFHLRSSMRYFPSFRIHFVSVCFRIVWCGYSLDGCVGVGAGVDMNRLAKHKEAICNNLLKNTIKYENMTFWTGQNALHIPILIQYGTMSENSEKSFPISLRIHIRNPTSKYKHCLR